MRKSILNENQIMNFEFQIERMERTHLHQSIEILYVLEGNPEVKIQDKVYRTHPEDIIVINANKKHSYQSKEDVLIGFFEIDFRILGDMLETNHLLFWCNSVQNKNAAYDDMRRIMKQIFSQYFEKKGYGQVILQSMYYQLLQVLLENFMVQSDDRRFEGERSQDEERLTDISNYIHSNYRRKISLSELSEALYLSVPYLSKYIKRKMGMNFIDCVNNIRLFHALDDLLYTNNSITAIALENGFASAAAFTKLLKSTYNMTPSEYRQQMKSDSQDGTDRSSGNQKQLLEQRVSSYLDNQLVQEPTDINCGDKYIILDTEQITECKHYWKKMVNVGRVEDLLRSDMREQVVMLCRDLGFRYVRMWELFSEQMLLGNPEKTTEYNFNRVDSVFDFLAENKIRPYLEMGFKPRQLHGALNNNIYEEKVCIPFTDKRKYEHFLNAFLTHLINRYGLEEVENWYFEQWCGEDFGRGAYDERFWELFDCLYQVGKKHSDRIRIGGGGVGIQYGTERLKKMADEWGRRKFKPDFISFYCYPYIRGDEDGIAFARQSTDRDFLGNQLEMAESVIDRSALKGTPIHVTEWSSTISNRNVLNDSCYKGAYILKGIIDCFDKVEVLGYWVGSDIFAEHLDSSRMLFGGCGLINSRGIKKPAFYAYRFLNYLGKYLLYRGDNCIVTTNGNNNYSIVCHNYRHLNYKYFLKSENELEAEKLYQLYEDNQPVQINYQLTHLKNGKYKVKTYSVSEESGSIQKEWQKLGYGGPLSGSEIDYLKRICTPHIQIRTCDVTRNVLNFETRMQAQEIQYIHISYLYE